MVTNCIIILYYQYRDIHYQYHYLHQYYQYFFLVCTIINAERKRLHYVYLWCACNVYLGTYGTERTVEIFI